MSRPGSRLELAGYFVRLGALGFGGPVALVGAMHRDLVDGRGWLTDAEYREGLALAQLAPGPLAAQLCFYIGYLRGGVAGALLSGLAFVLPGFLIVVGLGAAYLRYGGLSWMQAVFYGVGAAVIGLIARSASGLARRTLSRDPLLWLVAAILMTTTALTGRESPLLIVLGGVAVWLLRAPPGWIRRRVALEAGSVLLLLQLLGFFTWAGTFVFGSGLAIVPFLRGGVVQQYQWLTERQFLDAVAVAMITPGPVVITTGFIGFLVAGWPGAVLASAGTFLPCFLLTILPAGWFHRHGSQPWLNALVAGITAGSVGALSGAVLVLGRGAVRDLPTALLAAGALLLATRRVPDLAIIAGAASVGLLLQG